MKTSQSAGLKALLAKNPQYAAAYQVAVNDAQTQGAGQLSRSYPKEYVSWRNRKKWSRDFNVIWAETMDSFSGFILVNGPIPHPNWTLDRIDPKGNYVPSNIRWASKATQSQNRTNARLIMVNGEPLTLNEIALRSGKPYDTVRMGLERHGDAYVFNLLDQSDQESPEMQEGRDWKFPEGDREVAEELYAARTDREMLRPRFYAQLAADALAVERQKLEGDLDAIERAASEAIIAYVEPQFAKVMAFRLDVYKRMYLRQCREETRKQWPNIKDDFELPLAPDWDPDYHHRDSSGDLPWETGAAL